LLREIDKLTAIRSLRRSPDLFADTSTQNCHRLGAGRQGEQFD